MNRLYAIFFVWLAAYATLAMGQNSAPYRLQTWRETGIIGGSVLGIGTAFYLKHHKKPLTETQINLAMANPQCPRWECFVTHNWNTQAQQKSDVLLYGSMAAPLLLLLSPTVRADAPKAVTIGMETYLLTGALTNLAKELVQRRRPFVYNTNAPMSEKTKHDATSSFFSGHTSYSAAGCFMTAKMFSDYYPDSRWRPVVWTGAALIPLATAYYRVKGGKHFVSDVLIGYLVGATVGILVPQWHRRQMR